MAEYISREAAVEKITFPCELREIVCNPDDEFLRGLKNALNAVKSNEIILSAEVQPVKHGYWEEVTDYGDWGDTHYRCSVCGEEWYLEDGKPKDNNMNFCPRCGAKMDAEPDEPWQPK